MESIVRMTFGSYLYGTNTPSSDVDYKGVFMPEVNDILLQRVPHSIAENTKKDDTKKSTKDDVDSEMYSLNHFVHLACQGETVALDMLHAPVSAWMTHSDIWANLVAQRERFYTKNLKAFVGYARKQAAKYGVKGSRLAEAKRALAFLKTTPLATIEEVWSLLPEGEYCRRVYNDEGPLYYEVCGKKMSRGARCGTYLPMMELFVARYGERAKQAETNEGIDWKAVSHAFRAAYQVKHILVDGGYTYPLPETEWIVNVKSGQMNFVKEVAPRLDELIDELEGLTARSTLPETVDRDYWGNWLSETLLTSVRAHTLR